jgi:hypothetical protein
MRYTLSAPTSPARMNGLAGRHCCGTTLKALMGRGLYVGKHESKILPAEPRLALKVVHGAEAIDRLNLGDQRREGFSQPAFHLGPDCRTR